MSRYARLVAKLVLVTLAVPVVAVVTAEVAGRVIPAGWEPRISWYAGFAVAFVTFVRGLVSIFKDLREIFKPVEQRGVEPATLQEHLVAQVRSQVAREQNRKRYIPDVFVEVSVVKDQARFFAHPVLFMGKVVDSMNRLDFSAFNRMLLKLSQRSIRVELTAGFESTNSLEEVEDVSSLLLDILGNAKNGLTAFSDPWTRPPPATIPTEKRYIYDEIEVQMAFMAKALEPKLDRCAEDLQIIRSRVLFLIGRAGQGKTNFVCDFAMNVLLRRSLPCLFLTGGDFNRVDPDGLSDYLAGHVVGDMWGGELRRMLADLDRLALTAQAPVTIIIDGLSDHTDIHGFSQGLEILIEEILRDSRYVRFILTCRSEYFDQRFANFKHASFAQQTCFVESFERYMRSGHKEHLVDAYLKFFNLRCPHLSQPARERLESDTLLLRMFCEAYGDPTASDVEVLPQIADIYRDEIFRVYLRRKLEWAAEYSDRDSRLDVGVDVGYKRLLSRILELMIERGQFADIPIVDLGDEHNSALADILGEDIIIRRDLVRDRSVLDDESEVISFTFDEFRDFLLSDHLVTVVFPQDVGAFQQMVDRYCAPGSLVAEGVSRFLFYASKRPGGGAILDVIAEAPWYHDVFLQCIFSVQEDLITGDDLEQIESRFDESPRTASRIIRSLIRRWRTDIYPTLNIRLLFRILDRLDASDQDRLVGPALREDRFLHSYYDRPWPIGQLADQILNLLIRGASQSSPCWENLAELLVYLFDIQGLDRSFPAYAGFCEFAEIHPDLAVTVLARHTTMVNSRIAERVWSASSALAGQGWVSSEMVEEARRQLGELRSSNSAAEQRLAGSVAHYLSVCGTPAI